jgi:hypothetical protein
MRAAEEVGDKVALLERYRKTRDGRPRQEGTDLKYGNIAQLSLLHIVHEIQQLNAWIVVDLFEIRWRRASFTVFLDYDWLFLVEIKC